MERQKDISIVGFLVNQSPYIEKLESKLRNELNSQNKRQRLIQEALERGINFGIARGKTIEKNKYRTLLRARIHNHRRRIQVQAYKINEEISEHIQRTKYKK